MNIFLFLLLIATVQSTSPFHWDFDLKRCDRIYGGYDCYAPVNGVLSHIKTLPFNRTDFQMHPHVIAINTQSNSRLQVIMQSRYRKEKVDTNFGMILHLLPKDKVEEKLLECKVVNGKVELSSSADLETEMIDSYFDDNHLYCDYIVRTKNNKTFEDIVYLDNYFREKVKFALSVSIGGTPQKYVDDLEYDAYVHYLDRHNYIAGSIRDVKEYKCDLSQAKFDPKDAPKGGKLRSWEVFLDDIKCTDNRYMLHVSDSKGRKMENARISCRDGNYAIRTNSFSFDRKQEDWTLEKGETFSAYCHVEDSLLCPLTIPCNGSNCPYAAFHNGAKEYKLACEDLFKNILVVGEREFPWTWSQYKVNCNWQHNLVVSSAYYDDFGKGRSADATEAFCVKEDEFYHPNCVRRDNLCDGKSCSIVKSDKKYVYTVSCKNPNHVFQEFSTATKQWSNRDTNLHCNKFGSFESTWQKFVRCKDPADTAPPPEWEEPNTSSNKEGRTAKTNNPTANKGDSSSVSGQIMNAFSIPLMFVFPMLNVR